MIICPRPRNGRSAIVASIAMAGLAISLAAYGVGQAMTKKAPTSKRVKVSFIPFPTLDQTAAFTTRRLPRATFIEMVSFCGTFPKGFAKLKAPQAVVQLEYGFKKSGVVRIYETPKVKGETASSFMNSVIESRAFRDIGKSPSYLREAVPDGNLFLVITTNNKAALAAAKSGIMQR